MRNPQAEARLTMAIRICKNTALGITATVWFNIIGIRAGLLQVPSWVMVLLILTAGALAVAGILMRLELTLREEDQWQ